MYRMLRIYEDFPYDDATISEEELRSILAYTINMFGPITTRPDNQKVHGFVFNWCDVISVSQETLFSFRSLT